MSGRWRSWAAGAAAAAALWAAAAGPAFATDPIRGSEWPLDAQHFRADEVWALSRGAGVTVAVVDSGVAASHPDLAGQVLPGTSLLGDGGDGRSDTSGDSHGTAVSGIIAGTGGADGQGMTGLAPDSKVLPVKVTTGDRVSPSVVAQGIVWAVDHGAKVVNVSLGTETPDALLKRAVAYALQQDVVVVASAGNQGRNGNPVQYPAAFPGVLSVSGTNRDGSFWAPGESGTGVAVAAPASDVYSTNDLGQYVHAEGTSYAAAYVSATAALIRARRPELTQGQVVRRIITGTREHRDTPDARFGYGLLDPLAALTVDISGADPGNPLASPTAAAKKASAPSWPAWTSWTAGVLVVLAAGTGAAVLRRRRSGRIAEAPAPPAPEPRRSGKASPPPGSGPSPKTRKKAEGTVGKSRR
ncbi:type VII secretion-associated serine protease mycosin [Kitasatospora sp. YST-16]|uniref:type VII secretion-associated serine protease mycosin n=1 Tax=Kitasatospora sp. YST-16 TaxID=2998080 RepID=UPI002283D922|nr:type VII secretion-associated serine protease mycosin [Kitasatospora sp. YST-16]WAL70675.1 type VII secretion-associated serine protease mycosin [Kitasatospora sp. YST-16]WNW36718.1 type VII secretion-associated serine protease mycosin [Streptomyces sp. Li-HN-5-13]